jgi:hypothetical protein
LLQQALGGVVHAVSHRSTTKSYGSGWVKLREVAENFEDQGGEEGGEDEEKESELETYREKRQRIAAASSKQAPGN